jgi:DNA-binding LytR/AlgR family response regulator
MPHNKIICLAVDDEPPALEVIRNHISLVPSLELAAACINAVEGLSILQKTPVDLLFLDIQMPRILGTDFVRTLKNPPKVIFTTAYRKFAVEGFELDAVDYLLKPISFERFLKAVNKVMEPVGKAGLAGAGTAAAAGMVGGVGAGSPNVAAMPEGPKTRAEGFIHFRADRKVLKVALQDILYIESLKDYIRVVTTSKTIITKQSISSLEEMLPGTAFTRIHRSYIVALDKIESYTSELIGIAKQELPVSRMYRHELAKILKFG